VADSDGIGETLENGGAIKLTVQGKEVEVPAREMSTIEVEWKNQGDEKKADWQITSMTITKGNGEKVTGKPTWLLHASFVKMDVGGKQERVAAFPLGRTFDPNKLVDKITLGEGAGAATPAGGRSTEGPAPTTTAPTTAAPGPGPTTVVSRPPLPTTSGSKPAAVALTIQCPKCGEFITVDLAGYAR